MLFIAIGSLATAGSFIFILYSLSPKLLKTVLGYRVWMDILMSTSLTLMAIATGTISGLVIGSLSAIVMTLSLVAMKKVIGYRKYEKDPVTGIRSWVDYEGTTTATTVGGTMRDVATKAFSIVSSFFSGLVGSSSKSTVKATA